jgi:hypothetical protein
MKSIHAILFWILLSSCGLTQSEAQSKVYITKTGAKYHLSTCRYLKYSRIEISISVAVDQGYTPCSVCKPTSENSDEGTIQGIKEEKTQTQAPTQQGSGAPPKPVTNPVDETVRTTQCTALTKAGLRCKRTTTNSNGRCWQHQ